MAGSYGMSRTTRAGAATAKATVQTAANENFSMFMFLSSDIASLRRKYSTTRLNGQTA